MNQTPTEERSQVPSSKGFSKARLLLVFRVIVAILVVAALAWTINKAMVQFREQPIELSQVNFGKLVLAVFVYLVTMTLSWTFWHRVLIALRQQPSTSKSLKAFFVSQLGKYVPGKAMVVILRTDLVQDENVAVAPAAASVFVETLTWIFVGAMIASLLMILKFDQFRGLQVAAMVMMACAGVLTWPPVFNKIANRIKPIGTSGMTYTVDFRTMILGWLLLTAGWCLNGLSLWLVVDSLPAANPLWSHFPLMLAAVTLATVGGFVSLLPGGLGVRELVMIPLLGSQFGTVTAIIAAIVIRFVWLAAELIASAIMGIVGTAKNG